MTREPTRLPALPFDYRGKWTSAQLPAVMEALNAALEPAVLAVEAWNVTLHSDTCSRYLLGIVCANCRYAVARSIACRCGYHTGLEE